jgi:hypothetical protein
MRTLEKGIKEGFFREDINTEILAILRLEEFQMSIDDTIYPEEKFNMLEVQMQLFHHFVFGIVTEKGFTEFKHFIKNHILQ